VAERQLHRISLRRVKRNLDRNALAASLAFELPAKQHRHLPVVEKRRAKGIKDSLRVVVHVAVRRRGQLAVDVKMHGDLAAHRDLPLLLPRRIERVNQCATLVIPRLYWGVGVSLTEAWSPFRHRLPWYPKP